jgi:hydroxymethylpyrimidine/phosphomethylpyrimidine kinase
MKVVLEDLGADAVKTGMLSVAATVVAIVEILKAHAALPLVVDPVMVATSGGVLAGGEAMSAQKAELLPRAALVTPNLPEAAALTGLAVGSLEDMIASGKALLALGARAALVKGGHLEGGVVNDVLVMPDSVRVFESPRLKTRHTHGTGCTLASAIATGLAQGLALPAAVQRALDYVHQAILTAPGFGRGHGPLNHGHTVRPFGI